MNDNLSRTLDRLRASGRLKRRKAVLAGALVQEGLSMSIRCLSFVEYEETGWRWHEEKICNPSWDTVISAVNRLDKFRYPWVSLYIGDNDEDLTVDCLTIMGGNGVYWIALSAGRYDQLRLFDADKGSTEVDLWTSDQGFSDHEFHTTQDIDLVLRIAKYFAETGEPLPEPIWEF